MKILFSNPIRAMRTVLLALLLMAMCCLSALAAQEMRINTDTRIYQSPDTSSLSIPVPAGLQVRLHAVQSGWALVENGGVYAFMNAGHLSGIDENEPDYDELMKNAQPAVITADARIYRTASTASASARVNAGLKVDLLCVDSGWALIENGGVYAYIDAGCVAPVNLAAPSPEPTDAPLAASAQPALITRSTRVYRSARTSSASVPVGAGMRINLLAVSGNWALVENGGVYAYMNAAYVTPVADMPLLALDPAGLLDNAVRAAVHSDSCVYQYPSPSSLSLAIPAGMQLNVLAIENDWALVENGGLYAYMNAAHLTPVATATPVPSPTPAPTATPEPEQPDFSHLLAAAKPAVVSADTLVFRFADMSSSSIAIPKGTQVRLLAVSDGWALIERSGVYGFTNADHVALLPDPTAVPTPTPKPTPAPTPVPENYLTSSKYTNEEKCFIFLTTEMDLNPAAACGILANFYRESRFEPDIGGEKYYGLCQWGGGRRKNLTKFCDANGYSEATLEGQLNFLNHELKTFYPKVLSYLQSVESSADGAYNAGYHFCYYYEIPANRASSSASRGERARDVYYPKYTQ